MKVVSVVGARPQFIKAAAVSRAIARRNVGGLAGAVSEVLVHTGQHYDDGMSAVFFRELGLADSAHNLAVGSGSHATQTGEMLQRLEPILLQEKPDVVVVYGDTNSTLAGALVAAKLGLPIAHVEAGLRSFNRRMPEEINRVVTDHLSTWLFCPSREAVDNLESEGIREGVHQVGDVMYDVLLWQRLRALALSDAGSIRDLRPGEYALTTVHRAENTDDPKRLRAIFEALERIAEQDLTVVVPLHPRTQKALAGAGLVAHGLKVLPPASYEQMLTLEMNARVILTDSGGVQKEAYWLGVPCVTLRDETEWPETLAGGWNVLVGVDSGRITSETLRARPLTDRPHVYGDGHAAERIVSVLLQSSGSG